jgi:hypothetical protein
MTWIWECMVLSLKVIVGGFFWLLVINIIPMTIGSIIGWLENIGDRKIERRKK